VLDGGSVNYRLEVLYRIQHALCEQNLCGPRRRSIVSLYSTKHGNEACCARLSGTLPRSAVESDVTKCQSTWAAISTSTTLSGRIEWIAQQFPMLINVYALHLQQRTSSR